MFLVDYKGEIRVRRGERKRKPPIDTYFSAGATIHLSSKHSFSDFCVPGIGSSMEVEWESLSFHSDKDNRHKNRAL